MNMSKTYKQLTNVDIKEQQQIWDERGKGYYGEYLVFCNLYKSIAGTGKILMNLNIPVDQNSSTEIDLLLIHETGLYVFEIKHYKGTIYGKDTDSVWTQYFRTTKNNVFKNPIEQNGYHIRALKRLFPELPIRSCIVFTSDECDVRVSNANSLIDIFTLAAMPHKLQQKFAYSIPVLSMETIDNIFSQLSTYSPMQKISLNDSEPADFFSWINPTIAKLESKLVEIEHEKSDKLSELEKQIEEAEKEKGKWISQTQVLKKAKNKGIVSNIIIALVCIGILFVALFDFDNEYEQKASELESKYQAAIEQNNNELKQFKQKFLHIDEIDNPFIDDLQSYVTVSEVSLEPLTDDAVNFSANVAHKTDLYGFCLTEDSCLIVKLKSGIVGEYSIFGPQLSYNRLNYSAYKGWHKDIDLPQTQFYGIANTNSIEYIKITGISLLEVGRYNKTTVIKENLEIELYKN